jgi:hypothetical protein
MEDRDRRDGNTRRRRKQLMEIEIEMEIESGITRLCCGEAIGLS